MDKEASAMAIVTKLGDQAVLRNYCTFAGMHRAVVAETLFRALGADPNQRRSIGLEITGNFVAALEDVALWFFVLKEWKMEQSLLFDLLDAIQVRESAQSKYSSLVAQNELAKWTIADLRREFGLPTDDELLKRGWTEMILTAHINGLRGALEILRTALEMRTEDEHVLVSSYNKIKHGALAIAATEHSPIDVSVMLSSRRGPLDKASGKRKINTGWMACEGEALRRLVDNTIQVSFALWQILNFLYMARFDPSWKTPPWPYPVSAT